MEKFSDWNTERLVHLEHQLQIGAWSARDGFPIFFCGHPKGGHHALCLHFFFRSLLTYYSAQPSTTAPLRNEPEIAGKNPTLFCSLVISVRRGLLVV